MALDLDGRPAAMADPDKITGFHWLDDPNWERRALTSM
jgi:hypothetical protein